MAKKQLRTVALILVMFALGSILFVACARPGTASSAPAPTANPCPSGTSVDTDTSSFAQSCITLAKGATLTVNGSSTHILDYGQWNGNSAVPATPASAPPLKDLQLSGASVKIGPFTTAGTYHIYCTIHPNMNLAVVVQ